jgi:hypothetical protein
MNFDVGDIVYAPYSPQKAGVVVAVHQPPDKPAVCTSVEPQEPGTGLGSVLGSARCSQLSGHAGEHCGRRPCEAGEIRYWPQPVQLPVVWFTPVATYRVRRLNGSEFQATGLSSFQRLIDDHRKKLQTHEAKLARLLALKAELDGQ